MSNHSFTFNMIITRMDVIDETKRYVSYVEVEMKTIGMSFFRTETHKCFIIMKTTQVRAFTTWNMIILYATKNWICNCD